MFPVLNSRNTLPEDGLAGTLIGRAWMPGSKPGPCVVTLTEKGVFNISRRQPTVADLLNQDDPAGIAEYGIIRNVNLGTVEDVLNNTGLAGKTRIDPYFLAPVDLQAIKGCGLTFAVHLLSDAMSAAGLSGDANAITPGSSEVNAMRDQLSAKGHWSDHLEVAYGPYAEIFTKGQPMSASGPGKDVGVHPGSKQNNCEAELVLIINDSGRVVGATLGNDVNLRDIQDRSGLLLGRAKDNNGSCSLGPFIRLLDDTFTMDDIRTMKITLDVEGQDGYTASETFSMSDMTRGLDDLIEQSIGMTNYYPDGMALFVGTGVKLTADRDGAPFSHKGGDVVTISTPKLGALVNRVGDSADMAPWHYGPGALMKNLAYRGLL